MRARTTTLMLLVLLAAAVPANATDEPAIVDLIDRCGSPRLAEREQAFRALLEASPDDAAAIIAGLDKHRAGRARTRCARVLGRLGVPESREALEAALRTDASEYVRAAAAHALGDLGDRRAAPALTTALQSDTTTRVRRRAAVSLTRVTGAAAYAILDDAREREPEFAVRLAFDWLSADRGRRTTRTPRMPRGTVVEGAYEGTRYLVSVPPTYERSEPPEVLVVIHGTDGRPQSYIDMVRPFAEENGFVVIAPWFDWPTFPNFGMLNPGLDEVRADARLLEIVDAVAARLEIRKQRLRMFGHSQGGAFVHRFAVTHPDRVLRAVSGSANSYVDLESDDAFPWGVGPSPFLTHLAPIRPDAFARVPMLIVVGGAEERRFIDPARRFVEQMSRIAKERAFSPATRYQEIPGSGHSGAANFDAARRFLLGDQESGSQRTATQTPG